MLLGYRGRCLRRLRPWISPTTKQPATLAHRLHLINSYLDSVPTYWVDVEIEDLCRTIIRHLEILVQRSKGTITKRIATFIREEQDKARDLESACDKLLRKVNGHKETEAPRNTAAPQQPDVSETFNGVFKVFELISKCDVPNETELTNETRDIATLDEQSYRVVWHPARLCLHDLQPNKRLVTSGTAVLVSDSSMSYWQEFAIRTYV